MLEDELLKWKLRCGSREAMARVYEKYVDGMLTLAAGLLNNRAAAEDVVQDVFLSFARSARGLKPSGNLRGYLATSVVNRVRDRKRQSRRQSVVSDVPPDVPCDWACPDQRVIFTEQAARLSDAVAELPDEQREVVLLRLKSNMKFRDIARLQQTSINTVLGRYRYGLDKLRVTLNGEVEE